MLMYIDKSINKNNAINANPALGSKLLMLVPTFQNNINVKILLLISKKKHF